MPSSMNLTTFGFVARSRTPFPSWKAIRVSMSEMHAGPTERTASRSSVEIHESFPPGKPSKRPSKSVRTAEARSSEAYAVAVMAAPVHAASI